MKMKRTFIAGAAAVAGTWIMPAPVLADPPTYIVTQCSDSTCYVMECQSYPNINDSDWSGNGCAVLYSYPRPREVSGD